MLKKVSESAGIKFVFFSILILLIFLFGNLAIITTNMLHVTNPLNSLLLIVLASFVAMLFFVKILYDKIMAKSLEVENMVAEKDKAIENLDKLLDSVTALYNDAIEYDRLKTEFFCNISHELKTPLSVILGAIQLIEQGKALRPPKHTKHLLTIRQNCYMLLRLLNNILDITRIDSGFIKINMVNTNIVYLVEEIAQSVLPYAEQKKLSIEFDTEEEEIITAVDVDKIEKIVLNLLSNAIKFTPSGGMIKLYISRRDESVLISIKDTGYGIPPEMQSIIFERFRQVNSALTRKFEGSGIGLSLVKSFVELHEGVISVNSDIGKGSEFVIQLPIRICKSDDKTEVSHAYTHQDRIIEAINIELSDMYSAAASCWANELCDAPHAEAEHKNEDAVGV